MAVDFDRLLSTLNASGLQIKDNPLYQVISQLIVAARESQKQLSAEISEVNESIVNIDISGFGSSSGIPGMDGIDGQDGFEGMIGPMGPVGPTGAAGVSNSPGPMGMPGLDGYDGEEGYPGIQGLTGSQGATGAVGPTGPTGGVIGPQGFPGLDGVDGEDSYFLGPQGVPGSAGSGGGSSWVLIEARAASGTEEDFTGLSAYTEILVALVAVTVSGAGAIRQLLVSTDNGSTFLNTSGDYISTDSNGAGSNQTVLSFDNGNNASAHYGWIMISGFNLAGAKIAWNHFPAVNLPAIIPTTTALNAIRVRPHTNSFNGGTVYVFGR